MVHLPRRKMPQLLRAARMVVCVALALPGVAAADPDPWDPPEAPESYATWKVSLSSGGTQAHSFSMSSAKAYDILVYRLSGTGNVDLYGRAGTPPTLTSYDCGPQEPAGDPEHCLHETTSSGTYHILLHADGGAATYRVYVIESDAFCHSGEPGSLSHCSTSCICGWSLGDCDSDSECASGLTCVADVGADYGWSSTVDVCRGAPQ